MSRIIKSYFGFGAYKGSTGHLLMTSLKAMRLVKSKELIRQRGAEGCRKILFSEEKLFTIEQKFNKQSDQVHMCQMSYDKITKLHLCETGLKTSAKFDQEDVLERLVKPLNENMFNNEHWIFQQDSVPAHKAKTTQAWLTANVPAFISMAEWPFTSPDLNPLDYELWAILKSMAYWYSKGHDSLESLKMSLNKVVDEFPMEVVRAEIDPWPIGLKECVKNREGYFVFY
jgi:hypothetical protein